MDVSGDKRIRVLIVDDHPIVLAGLRAAIERNADLEVVGEARTGEEALARVEQLDPAVVLMDLVMPGMSGLQAADHLQQKESRAAVIIMSGHCTDDLAVDAIRVGARGVLPKESGRSVITAAVRMVAQGAAVLPFEALARIVARHPAAAPASRPLLTDREQAVLRLLAHGSSTSGIAADLGLAVPTVKKSVHAILKKLGASDRGQAVAHAIRSGLVE